MQSLNITRLTTLRSKSLLSRRAGNYIHIYTFPALRSSTFSSERATIAGATTSASSKALSALSSLLSSSPPPPSSNTDVKIEKVKIAACGDVDSDDDDDGMEQEEMFVDAYESPSFGHGAAEWGGPRRGGRLLEPTRFGDWERKGRCSDF